MMCLVHYLVNDMTDDEEATEIIKRLKTPPRTRRYDSAWGMNDIVTGDIAAILEQCIFDEISNEILETVRRKNG